MFYYAQSILEEHNEIFMLAASLSLTYLDILLGHNITNQNGDVL